VALVPQPEPTPYLVLLDLKMPVKDGIAVLDWLQTHPGRHKLVKVVLSSSDHPADMDRAMALGAHAYFPKPIQPGELLAFLRECQARWLTPGRRPPVVKSVEGARA
jgi:CheY-like chemotaxis protein